MFTITTKEKILNILRGSDEPMSFGDIYEKLGAFSKPNLSQSLKHLEIDKKVKCTPDAKKNKKYEIVNSLMIIMFENIEKYGEFDEKEFYASIIKDKYVNDFYAFYEFLEKHEDEVLCK